MAQRVIGGNLANHRNKLGFVHIPKCAGSAITGYLHNIGRWRSVDNDKKTFAAEPFITEGYVNYKLFTVIRHPVTWILSGYKFYKQRRNYMLSFDEHVDSLVYNTDPNISNIGDWRWHCKILPDLHIGTASVKVFKLEELYKLPEYLSEYFPYAKRFEVVVENAADPEHIEINSNTMNKIKTFAGSYAEKFEYEL